MKKLLLLFCSLLFLFNCQSDRDFEDQNSAQFGFTVERDENFIEKAVGETNQLKFNIKPNYNFSSLETSVKFTTNLDGVLKLNSEVLNANQKYTLTSQENIFEYVGNVSGTHQLKFTVQNSKGFSVEESFELKYSISEFALTYVGGTADIYQGDETNYLMKIIPGAGQLSSGYQIRFNDYNSNNGSIKLNGVDAQTGQFYPLPNIDNFNILLKTNKIGQGALNYTLKNSTVSKDYDIQQTIIARQIVVESMNINSTSVVPNSPMSLIGIVKKAPVTSNSSVSYKTWISSASNNNMAGIQNTNNVYIPYALTSTGSFNYNFNGIDAGTYTYNIQFKDEYGNESDIESFTIEVQAPLQFVGSVSGSYTMSRQFFPSGGGGGYRVRSKEYMKGFKVQAGGSNSITQIKYEYRFTFAQTPRLFTYEENFNTGNNTVEYNNTTVPAEFLLTSNNFSFTETAIPIVDGTLKITAFASDGTSITKTVPIDVNFVNY